MLENLKIPIESQMAVFSKISVQAKLINPQNPRTLFFNDSTVIGWVRGGFIEVATESPSKASSSIVFSKKTEKSHNLDARMIV